MFVKFAEQRVAEVDEAFDFAGSAAGKPDLVGFAAGKAS
jgi:hypothetical protein